MPCFQFRIWFLVPSKLFSFTFTPGITLCLSGITRLSWGEFMIQSNTDRRFSYLILCIFLTPDFFNYSWWVGVWNLGFPRTWILHSQEDIRDSPIFSWVGTYISTCYMVCPTCVHPRRSWVDYLLICLMKNRICSCRLGRHLPGHLGDETGFSDGYLV